jgi:Calx-beta domain
MRAGAGGKNDQWALDPADVRRHARRLRERQRVGPLGKAFRYAAVAVLLAGIGAVYWNFDVLRGMTVDFPGLNALFATGPGEAGGETTLFGGKPDTAVVEATEVAGAEAPTSLSSERPPKDAAPATAPRPAAAPASTAPTSTTPTAQAAAAPAERQIAAATPPPAPVAEPPPGPEQFSFGLDRIEVSEANASADLLILRSGDMRRASTVTWWTSDGTATAGQDYANLGRVVVKFAPNEQNRGIHIPIIGDRTAEGPENFYVNLLPGDPPAGEATERVEVVIKDDD